MTEMLRTISDAPRAVLASETKVFRMTYAEWLLLGSIAVALCTGPLADLDTPGEAFHFHNIISIGATVGACVVSFATGRMSAKE